MLAVLGFLTLVGLGAAQLPVRCDSPAQWEAHYSMYDPVQGHQFRLFGRYHYDKENLRKARFEEIDEGRNSSYRFLEVIELYKENKRYEIDVRTRECRVTVPYGPFHAHDVPLGATFRSYFYLGSSAVEEGSIEFAEWSYYDTERHYYWEGSFTTHGCIPYHSNAFNHTTFGARIEEFWDVTPGISDPNVFIPPPQCR